MDNLQRTAHVASNLHAKLSGWLTSSGHIRGYPVRRCWDPQLVLPTVPSIEERLAAAGVSSELSRCISDLFLASSADLAESIVDEYKAAVQATSESHEFCCIEDTTTSICPLSRSIVAAFTRLFERQVQSLSNDIVSRASCSVKTFPHGPSGLSAFVTDYTPILEFAYTQSKKPNAHEKALLAQATGLELKQVNIWFQNRRARDKAGSFSKRAPPRTIDELGQRLKAHNQRHAVVHRSNGERSNNDCDDSECVSKSPRLASVLSVDDLARLLEDFHIDDYNETLHVAKESQCSTVHQMRPIGRTAMSSEDASIRRPIKRRPVSGRAKRSTTQSGASPYSPPPEGAGRRPVAGRPAFRTTRRPAFTNDRGHTPLTGVPGAFPVVASDGILSSPLPNAPSSPAEAVSANKAHRRKHTHLPARRPTRRPVGVVRDPSPTRAPSLSWSASATSRSSSLSSQMSPRTPPSDLPCADQLYYRNPSTGEFVPVAGGSIIITHTGQSSSVLTGEDASSVNDTVVLGPPAEPQLAPDHDPRAFSSNILRESLSHAEPTLHPAAFDFSCTLSGIQDSNTIAVSADDASSPALLQPLAATFSCKDLWAQPAGLDVVNYAYERSWTTNASHAETWAHLLSLDL